MKRLMAVSLLALLCAPASARAQEPPSPPVALHLEYLRGPGTVCPDEHVVADMLRGELDYEARDDAELRLVVEATRHGRQHRLAVVLRDATGEALWWRHPEAPTCTEALVSAMVSTALELGGVRLLREMRQQAAQPIPGPPPIVVAPIIVPAAPVLPPPVAAPAAPPVAFLLGVDALGVAGTTPGPSLGAGVFLAVRPALLPELSVEVTGRATATVSAVQEGWIPVRSTFYSGQLAVCGHLGFAYFCPVIGVGELEHHAVSVPHPVTVGTEAIDTTRPFAILGAQLGAEERFGRFLLHGFLELQVLPGGSKIALNGNELWRTSIGGLAGVGFALQP